ncbi:site-specific integrase [Nostoc sp. FACHB-888]|uniref:tyrosine-type recombinase/integrase n=1 Tax=Nostoc sp. FACHB-888 TaxID=2692842 RepID=UPI001685DD85|nr:site-specific integrase [Nostoc sp. FACHB-888]MBD2247411.1 site-specific integrase [Nostoc sp. FACHB-888]
MAKKNHPIVSLHATLHSQLEVDWSKEYKCEFICPHCQENYLNKVEIKEGSMCKVRLRCYKCNKYISLTCQVSVHICKYHPDIECPNPICTQRGHNGQKGWIYKSHSGREMFRCYFCRIRFKSNSKLECAWVNKVTKSNIPPFCFENDIWDLRNFFNINYSRSISFTDIYPQWYRVEAKKYLQYLLKIKVYSSPSGILQTLASIRKFGRVIESNRIERSIDINREAIRSFLNECKTLDGKTINHKLSCLKGFFDWLKLDASNLIRSRDYFKETKNDPDWLDEVTRTAIENHLSKIPAPIARNYLVQQYTAARPGDICQLNFDCLVKENGKWYIKFYQHKSKRWHQIPANREIRQIIEEQQKWIRETLGLQYQYLFCHFINLRLQSYPTFSTMMPLPKIPSMNADENAMTRIIRLLIEREDIHDANGQKPHFTGKITRHNRLQEIRAKHGIEAAKLYADHVKVDTTFQNYTPPTREEVAEVDLPFQELLINSNNKFLPWQSLPETLLTNPNAHELDLEIAPRLVVYGYCSLDPKTPCPVNLYPKCYSCSSFRPSTGKLPLYERQYEGEQQRRTEAELAGAELAKEEAKATIEAMDKWLPELKNLANG